MASDTSKAKFFEFNMVSNFAGYDSSRDKTNVAANVMVRGSQNIYKKLSGNLSVRQGQKRRGDANTTISPVSSSFIWNTSWGATYALWVTNSTLQVNYNDTWYTLLSAQTKTRWVMDKWWDNTEKKDRVLMVRGDSNLLHWSGGIAFVASATVNTITKTVSGTSWQQAGFASNTAGEKKIMINGTEYTYTGGENTATLTGVSPDPSAIAANTIAIQSVIIESNKPASGFNNDFIKVINNQAYIGSYTSRLVYVSKNTNFTDFTVPTPRAPGDPELLTLDGTGKGIGVRQGNPYIGFGSGSWAVITYNDTQDPTTGATTQVTKVDVKPVANLQAPYAHEFIDTVGDSLVYLAQDQQVRTFGDFNNLFTPGYPSFSQEIATELMEQDFTGGTLRCIGEFTYLTAPLEGKTWLYQVRNMVDASGQIVAERLWHSPFVWNLTKVDDYNGTIVGFSNSNPQWYDLWDTGQWFDDSPSEEPLPYSCVLAFSYRNNDRRQGLMSFDKHFEEGYLTTGTPLNLQINYNYNGALATVQTIVNSIEQPAYVFTPNNGTLPSLGDESLGDEPLGDVTNESGSDNTTELVKFKVINSLSLRNCFEYQPIFYSDAAGAQWEILAVGDNAQKESDQNATFIINKRRTV